MAMRGFRRGVGCEVRLAAEALVAMLKAMTSIGIFGSQGRMGQAIARSRPSLGAQLAGGADIGDDPADLARKADVLVDFSAPAALEAHLAAARAARTPIMIGTTGLGPHHHAMIDAAAPRSRCSRPATPRSASACSRGWCARPRAAGPDWDIEIVEMHHRNKVDAPSGTALMLGEAAARGRGTTLAEAGVTARAGLTGARAGHDRHGVAPRRIGRRRSQRDLRHRRRTDRAHPPRRRPRRSSRAARSRPRSGSPPSRPGRYTMDQVLAV
jgi:4-hydroxy-tetrahydrodipicolinate reductase